MLDQLKGLIKEYGADAIITNPAIPNERNDEAVDLASNSILDSLKNMVASGNINEVQSLFNTPDQNVGETAAANNIKGNFVEGLMQKFGLDQGKAGLIASSLIPMVLSKLVGKTNDPNDNGFDLSSIMGSLTGGNLGDILGNLTGGGDSKEGGLLDKVKGMFN